MRRRNFIKLIFGITGAIAASKAISDTLPKDILPKHRTLRKEYPIGYQFLWDGDIIPEGFALTNKRYYGTKIIQRVF